MYSATHMLAKAKSNPIYGKIRDKNNRYYRNIYLQSEHWKNLRKEKLEKNSVCEKCGSTLSLDIHHKEYGQLFNVTIKDLQTLCRVCHNKEHSKKKEKLNNNKIKKFKKIKRKFAKPTLEELEVQDLYYMIKRNFFHPNILLYLLKEIIEIAETILEKRYGNFNTYISIHY